MIIHRFWVYLGLSALFLVGSAPLNGVEMVPEWDFGKAGVGVDWNQVDPAKPSSFGPYAFSGLFVHLVRPGDTLLRVSRFYMVDSAEVARINGFDPSVPLRPGQELRIPED